MLSVRTALRHLRDIALLSGGGLRYALSGAHGPAAYQAMIRLFCQTGGVSNDVMSRLVSLFERRSRLPEPRGSLGVTGAGEAARIAARLREDGYFVFEQRLPDDVCDRLLRFATSAPAVVRPMTHEPNLGKRTAVYDERQPLAVRYDFDASDVLDLIEVQSLLTDPTFLSVAQNYLGTTPVADVVSMWWHTAFSDQPDEEAAQFFHFDMDRIKWLKFFIYLTDVGPDSGAHCFVRGSHRTHGIPAALRVRGYARLTDEQVLEHYRPEDITEFHGARGTVIAEDTRGLHKGLAVRRGHRLMLQLQFSNSLFGGHYSRANFRSFCPELRAMVAAHPRIYKNYVAV
jgi:hypothetical protein